MPDSKATLISEPTALIAGSAAFLISRFLRSGPVVECMRAARWFGGPQVTEALHVIHEAGRAWETTLEVQQRDTARACELSGAGYETITVERTSEWLHLSPRRVQELARSGRIIGRRVGRRWELDADSVRTYQQQRRGSS